MQARRHYKNLYVLIDREMTKVCQFWCQFGWSVSVTMLTEFCQFGCRIGHKYTCADISSKVDAMVYLSLLPRCFYPLCLVKKMKNVTSGFTAYGRFIPPR